LPNTLLEKRGASIAVSNMSPLIALKHAGVLEKLSLLFQKIAIPQVSCRSLALKRRSTSRA